jgi:hypothetical protein
MTSNQSNLVEDSNVDLDVDLDVDEDFAQTNTSTNAQSTVNPFVEFKEQCEKFKLSEQEKNKVTETLKSKSNKEIIIIIMKLIQQILPDDSKIKEQINYKSKRELIQTALTYCNQKNMKEINEYDSISNGKTDICNKDELRAKLRNNLSKSKNSKDTHMNKFQETMLKSLLGDNINLKEFSKLSDKDKKKYVNKILQEKMKQELENQEQPQPENSSEAQQDTPVQTSAENPSQTQ